MKSDPKPTEKDVELNKSDPYTMVQVTVASHRGC